MPDPNHDEARKRYTGVRRRLRLKLTISVSDSATLGTESTDSVQMIPIKAQSIPINPQSISATVQHRSNSVEYRALSLLLGKSAQCELYADRSIELARALELTTDELVVSATCSSYLELTVHCT